MMIFLELSVFMRMPRRKYQSPPFSTPVLTGLGMRPLIPLLYMCRGALGRDGETPSAMRNEKESCSFTGFSKKFENVKGGFR